MTCHFPRRFPQPHPQPEPPYESQSSSVNASTPNDDPTSDVPRARLSAPRRTYLTSPSSSPATVSNRVDKSPSPSAWASGAGPDDDTIAPPLSACSPSAFMSRSMSMSESVSVSSSVSVGKGTENPMTSLRCRRCRRLRCRRILIDRREMSCVVSPANVVKNVRKWRHMSRMLRIAFKSEVV